MEQMTTLRMIKMIILQYKNCAAKMISLQPLKSIKQAMSALSYLCIGPTLSNILSFPIKDKHPHFAFASFGCRIFRSYIDLIMDHGKIQ